MHWYDWIIFGAVWMLIPALLLLRDHCDHKFAKAWSEDELALRRFLQELRAAPPAKGEK